MVKKVNKINKQTKNKKQKASKKFNFNSSMLKVITFLTAVFLIISSYAWFSSSLNVQIKFFDLVVSSDSGLFISIDGVNFSEAVEVSVDNIILDLARLYPNHMNQWAVGGMWPVSSNGIRNSNSDKFDVFIGEVRRPKGRLKEAEISYLNTSRFVETNPSAANVYVAFDIFLKNVSGSPYSDNLYFNDDTYIDFDGEVDDETKRSMSGIMNSLRMGLVKIGSVSLESDVRTIQNISCNNNCESVIFELNKTTHSEVSIEKAREMGITLIDGVYTPTYAVINGGTKLEHMSGHGGIPLNDNNFRLQRTISESDFANPIFTVPNGITKFRVYVWIEGQDVDSLETHSIGAPIFIALGLEKDLAGYEE